MLNATCHCIHPIEAAVIIIENDKTQTGLHLKQICLLLLINLAVADLLVGDGEVVVSRRPLKPFGASLSVIFLALISLEHLYVMVSVSSRNEHSSLQF